MNNLGFNPGFNQMTGDMQFQHHPTQQVPKNQMQLYQNSGYRNKRGKKKSLILDVKSGIRSDGSATTHLTQGTEFDIQLREPLIIDKHSEIYLDNLVTYNCNLSDEHFNSAFCLKINEFNIDTNVATIDDDDKNAIFNSIVIPNENNDLNNFFGAIVHKGKKFNYVCDINPCTISSISGKVTNLNGNPAFHGEVSNNHTHTYALVGITGWGSATTNILKNQTITSIRSLSPLSVAEMTAVADNGTVLADSQKDSSLIIFSTADDLTESNYNNATQIEIIVEGVTYTLDSSAFILRESPGCRMVAEFTIESFD